MEQTSESATAAGEPTIGEIMAMRRDELVELLAAKGLRPLRRFDSLTDSRLRVLRDLGLKLPKPDDLAVEVFGSRLSEAYTAMGHPSRLHILAVLFTEGAAMSPNEVCPRVGVSLGTCAYHVRKLAHQGYLEKASERRVRGAVEHFYVLTDKARKLRGEDEQGEVAVPSPEYLRGRADMLGDVIRTLNELPDGRDERIAMHLIEVRSRLEELS